MPSRFYKYTCPDCGQPCTRTYCRKHGYAHRKPVFTEKMHQAAQSNFHNYNQRKLEQAMEAMRVKVGATNLREYLAKRYETETIREIGRDLGMAENMQQWFHKLNIPIRTKSEEAKRSNTVARMRTPVATQTARANQKAMFDAMTPEERSAWGRRAGAASYVVRQQNGHQTQLETELYNLLDALSISYTPQFQIRHRDGYVIYVADALVSPNIIVEAYGDYWHTGRFEKRDQQRQKFIEHLGYHYLIVWGDAYNHLSGLDVLTATLQSLLHLPPQL
jgi:very-short-patch-repair endonuclease